MRSRLRRIDIPNWIRTEKKNISRGNRFSNPFFSWQASETCLYPRRAKEIPMQPSLSDVHKKGFHQMLGYSDEIYSNFLEISLPSSIQVCAEQNSKQHLNKALVCVRINFWSLFFLVNVSLPWSFISMQFRFQSREKIYKIWAATMTRGSRGW